MFKRFCLLVLMAALAAGTASAAQTREVSARGYGDNPEQAVTNALVAAVRQAGGVTLSVNPDFRRQVSEWVIQRQGDDRIMVQVPGLGDPQRLKALLNQTAKLTFQLVDQSENAEQVARGSRAPAGSQLLYTTDSGDDAHPPHTAAAGP